MRLRLFGYELVFHRYYQTGITDYKKEYPEEVPYVHDFNMEKRITAMVRRGGFIEYVFRDMDIAILTYNDVAEQLFEDVMGSFHKIRNRLVNGGATIEQLTIFDNKIHHQMKLLLDILKNRNDDAYNIVKDCEIRFT